MFDISFMEMIIVAIAALVIIGPERLPTVARQAGQWITRVRRYVEDAKSDFSRQMELAELKNLKEQVEDTARGFERSVQDTVQSTRSSFDQLSDSVDPVKDDRTTGQAGSTPADTAAVEWDSSFNDAGSFESSDLDDEPVTPTDWDKVYEDRRLRQRLRDRRIERERERGFKRPRFRVER
ncbi:MAG: Sec-independent protein translocase protein TatB [Lautropia sp.]|nr:Sec-independent protein translocase protein TatB [Lautropia sp.]